MTRDSAATIRDTLAFAGSSRSLADLPTGARPLAPGKGKQLRKAAAADGAVVAALQERLWAEATAGARRSVLLVLQGTDTSGKGGVTEHVVGVCGPIGVEYTAFKKPTAQEAAHDFLWRIRKRVPRPGVLGVFDRSHYEDVLVPVVHDSIDAAELNRRFEAINAFEQELADGGTTLVKCLLHIGFDTQRERLLARLDDPDKHWKFNPGDLDERALWPRYQQAYDAMLRRTDTAVGPWYVVPSDSKKYRNWAVGRLLRTVFETLDPHYPRTDLDVPALRARLAPPS